jgi:hypothetical protein
LRCVHASVRTKARCSSHDIRPGYIDGAGAKLAGVVVAVAVAAVSVFCAATTMRSVAVSAVSDRGQPTAWAVAAVVVVAVVGARFSTGCLPSFGL